MHFIDRYLLSMVIGAIVLTVMGIVFPPHWGFWAEVPHMWFVFASFNTLRLTFTRDRIVGGKK